MENISIKTEEKTLIEWMQSHSIITAFAVILTITFFSYLLQLNTIKKIELYKPPGFSNLRSTTGTIVFQPFQGGRWFNDGFYMNVNLVNQQHLTLKCFLIDISDAPCYQVKLNGIKGSSYKAVLAFQNATVRWFPIAENKKFQGMVYQIEIDGVPIIKYDSFVERYSKDYQRATDASPIKAVINAIITTFSLILFLLFARFFSRNSKEKSKL